MRIRIERPLPGPLMDGFDVHLLHAGEVYDVDERMARYLIIAGYAVVIEVDQWTDDRGPRRA